MKKIFFVFLFIFHTLNANSSIDQKILSTTKQLKEFKSKHKNTNDKLANDAKEILKEQKDFYQNQKKVQGLEKSLKYEQKRYRVAIKKLKGLEYKLLHVNKSKTSVESKLVFLIAKHISLLAILENYSTDNINTIISHEAIKKLVEITKKNMEVLDKKFQILDKQSKLYGKRINKKKIYIDKIQAQKKEYIYLSKMNQEKISSLLSKKKNHKIRLYKILNIQENMQNVLSKLKVKKSAFLQNKKRRAQIKKQKKRLEQQSANRISNANLPTVRQIGSSYQKLKTRPYRGLKTISPLKQYIITQQYGKYIDPIYNIKIFNDSITLKPKNGYDKVRNVFNGKVVLITKSSLLGNLIVVEHDKGMQTTYASVDQINTHLRTGKKIKKGTILGRVRDELIFGVSQKDVHFNPEELF
jgi:murein DD-endopeptidase MepM/ murein hydrolase activator NlpD